MGCDDVRIVSAQDAARNCAPAALPRLVSTRRRLSCYLPYVFCIFTHDFKFIILARRVVLFSPSLKLITEFQFQFCLNVNESGVTREKSAVESKVASLQAENAKLKASGGGAGAAAGGAAMEVHIFFQTFM